MWSLCCTKKRTTAAGGGEIASLAKTPCPSCSNLDPDLNNTPSYRLHEPDRFGDFQTFAQLASEAAQSGCPICSLLFTTAVFFVENASFWSPYCKLDIVLARPPDVPLQLRCSDEHEEMSIEFLTTSEMREPYAHFKPVPVISKRSDAPECFSRVGRWISECDAGHKDCELPEEVPLPTRVVDVNPTPDGLQPVLVETNGTFGRYAALSYSWGKSLPLKLTRSSIQPFKSGIPWSKIPKTLQDAMAITHRLGLRYIWIDALTIVQDDEADWKVEAAKMAAVYGSAFITIAATNSKDCQQGIFTTRESLATHYRVWPLTSRQKPVEVEILRDGEIYTRRGRRAKLSTHPLQKRGWTLQEHVLSRRVIQYTESELVWHCRTGRATEARPTLIKSARLSGGNTNHLEPAFLPQRDEIDDATRELLFNFWADIVKDYSQRKLTQESDKLYAILGVAEALKASGLGPYHAGIFEGNLLVGLTWYSKRYCPDSKWVPTHTRPKTYRAPSWSWASINGEIGWRLKDSDGRDNEDHLRGPLAQCKVVRISNTELVLRGKIIPGVLTRHTACLPKRPAVAVPGVLTKHPTSLPIRSVATNDGDTMAYSLGNSELHLRDSSEIDTDTDIVDTTLMHPGIDPASGLPKLPLDIICLLLGVRQPDAIPGFFGSNKHCLWACALVLTQSSANTGAYERVGINSHFSADSFEGAEEFEVTIV